MKNKSIFLIAIAISISPIAFCQQVEPKLHTNQPLWEAPEGYGVGGSRDEQAWTYLVKCRGNAAGMIYVRKIEQNYLYVYTAFAGSQATVTISKVGAGLELIISKGPDTPGRLIIRDAKNEYGITVTYEKSED